MFCKWSVQNLDNRRSLENIWVNFEREKNGRLGWGRGSGKVLCFILLPPSQIFSSSSLSFWLSPIGNLLMGVWEEETKWKTKLKKVADEVHNIPTMDNNLTTLLQQLAQLLNLQQQQCLTWIRNPLETGPGAPYVRWNRFPRVDLENGTLLWSSPHGRHFQDDGDYSSLYVWPSPSVVPMLSKMAVDWKDLPMKLKAGKEIVTLRKYPSLWFITHAEMRVSFVNFTHHVECLV